MGVWDCAGRPSAAALPEVEELQRAVVGDGRQHPGDVVVELDVVDAGGVVLERPSRLESFVGFGKVFNVPVARQSSCQPLHTIPLCAGPQTM